MSRWTLLPVVALLIALLCVPAANASRTASAQERKAITQAVVTSPVADVDEVPRNRYRVTGQRVSTVSPFWAVAQLVARPGWESKFQGASALAVKLAGTKQWVVVDVGTAEVGCNIAPPRVISDLFGLRGTENPCEE